MTRFIELADRVFRVRLARGTRHPNRWRLVVTVESGPEMTEAEADRLTAALVAEIVSAGGDVRRWLRG